jgi:hypothetical protein
MDNNRVAWGYTDDGAVTYRVSAKKDYTTQGGASPKQGGAAAASSVRRIPKDIKPRMVKMVDAATGNISRFLIAYAVDAPIWTTPGTTFNMDVNGASVAMVSTPKRRGEKSRDTTTQST